MHRPDISLKDDDIQVKGSIGYVVCGAVGEISSKICVSEIFYFVKIVRFEKWCVPGAHVQITMHIVCFVDGYVLGT